MQVFAAMPFVMPPAVGKTMRAPETGPGPLSADLPAFAMDEDAAAVMSIGEAPSPQVPALPDRAKASEIALFPVDRVGAAATGLLRKEAMVVSAVAQPDSSPITGAALDETADPMLAVSPNLRATSRPVAAPPTVNGPPDTAAADTESDITEQVDSTDRIMPALRAKTAVNQHPAPAKAPVPPATPVAEAVSLRTDLTNPADISAEPGTKARTTVPMQVPRTVAETVDIPRISAAEPRSRRDGDVPPVDIPRPDTSRRTARPTVLPPSPQASVSEPSAVPQRTADAEGIVPRAPARLKASTDPAISVEWRPRDGGKISKTTFQAPAAAPDDRPVARQDTVRLAVATAPPFARPSGPASSDAFNTPMAASSEAGAKFMPPPATSPPSAALPHIGVSQHDSLSPGSRVAAEVQTSAVPPRASEPTDRRSPQGQASLLGTPPSMLVSTTAPAPPQTGTISPQQAASDRPMATLSGEAGMAATVEAPDLSGTQHTREADAPRRGADIDIRPQQIARGAALQIAEAFRPLSEGSIDVRLSPEELGRVRLSLVPGEAGLSVQIVAERAETLELLRRHADLLGAELRDAGYDGLSFSFGREGERDAQPDASERTADIRATPVLSSEDLRSRTAMPIIPSSGIDIRL